MTMRATVVMLVTAVVLLLGLAGFAQPAAAEPAEPYRLAGCTTSGEQEFCFVQEGVTKVNQTPSGNTQVHQTAETCLTVTIIATGEVIEDDCVKSNRVVVLRAEDDDPQVWHSHETADFTVTSSEGTRYECTMSYTLSYANGEYRHEDDRYACTSPRAG